MYSVVSVGGVVLPVIIIYLPPFFFFNTSNLSIILGSQTFVRNLSNTFEYGHTSGLTSHKFFTNLNQTLTITDTKISGSATTTGSFARLAVGRGNTNSTYASTTGGDVAFGVDASSKRVILRAAHVEIGPDDYWGINAFTKDSNASLFVKAGIKIFTTGNNQGMRIYNTYTGGAYNSYVEKHNWSGTSQDGGHLVLRNYGSGGTQVWHGSNVVVDVKASATGSSTLLTLEDNKISGSAVSTGSFGQIEFATGGQSVSINGNANTISVGAYGATGGGTTGEYAEGGGSAAWNSSGIVLNASTTGATGDLSVTGGIYIEVDYDTMKNVPIGKHVYDLEITTSNQVNKILKGRFEVEGEVTR